MEWSVFDEEKLLKGYKEQGLNVYNNIEDLLYKYTFKGVRDKQLKLIKQGKLKSCKDDDIRVNYRYQSIDKYILKFMLEYRGKLSIEHMIQVTGMSIQKLSVVFGNYYDSFYKDNKEYQIFIAKMEDLSYNNYDILNGKIRLAEYEIEFIASELKMNRELVDELLKIYKNKNFKEYFKLVEWTEEQYNTFVKMYNKVGYKCYNKIEGKTMIECRNRAKLFRKLNIFSSRRKHIKKDLTKEDIIFILEHYKIDVTLTELGRMYGISTKQVLELFEKYRDDENYDYIFRKRLRNKYLDYELYKKFRKGMDLLQYQRVIDFREYEKDFFCEKFKINKKVLNDFLEEYMYEV